MADKVDLLWTGGWDSTYRIMEILSCTDCTIQPHYIVDPERTSWKLEIESMKRLRSELAGRNPDWADRIMETRVTGRREVAPDPAIENAFEEIRAWKYIGQQNRWLARYAKMSGLHGLELCVESTDAVGQLIQDRVRAVPGSDPPLYELRPARVSRDYPVWEVFQWFRFALIYRDKNEMEEAVGRMDAWPIMGKTWFCHQPVWSRYPCGTCRPCVYVVDKGQAWRVGPMGRIRFNTIERTRRLLPAGMKKYLRTKMGRWAKRFIRA